MRLFSGNIRVFCRLKPNPNSGPIILDPLDVDSVTIQTDYAPKRFLFDKVFGPETAQIDVNLKDGLNK